MFGMISGLAKFIESVGANVCHTVEFTVKGIAGLIRKISAGIKRSAAPAGRDTSKLITNFAGKPAALLGSVKHSTAEGVSRFARRAKLFGVRKAAVMQHRELRLAAKRRGGVIKEVLNVLFPVASVAALVMTINSVMSTDYGVAVEYDGEEIGVVSGEEVLGDAQGVVADRIRYYDTDGDYYVTAALAIKPLSSSDDVIDGDILARKMEGRISMQYDEKLSEADSEENGDTSFEENSGKVKAFAVRVDGELIGAVEKFDSIAKVLDDIKKPYDNGEYLEIDFDKDVEYDLEEYVAPEDIVSEETVLKTLTGYESAPEYYEVQPGDNLWNIADSKGMTLDELSGCYATYNGQVIDDLENQVLRVGTLIQLDSEVPYLQVECRKEVTIKTRVPYETITIEDATLPEGQIVIETEGSDGENRSRAIVTYREGTPVRKRNLETVVYNEPVSEIIRVGTADPNAVNYNVPEFIYDGGTGDYFWPVDGGYISSPWNGDRRHKGLDIAAPYGTPIYAAASGVVTDAGTGWNGGYGNCIVIENDDGNTTVYAHMSELGAELNQEVEQGQLIGYVGNTGDSNGNHLHFEVRKDGKYYNPEDFISQ